MAWAAASAIASAGGPQCTAPAPRHALWNMLGSRQGHSCRERGVWHELLPLLLLLQEATSALPLTHASTLDRQLI